MRIMEHFQVLIIGGGSAGITVAARLKRARAALGIAIIDPAQKHYYQPLWTLVGGGAADIASSVRNQKDLIPSGVEWLQSAVLEIDPVARVVKTSHNQTVSYDYLVVCPGIQIDWHKIKGLEGALGRDGVCSNYAFEQAPKTWEMIRTFGGGNALFTAPSTPIKCGGAPQKIMYLAESAFRRQGVREKAKVMFTTAGGVIFAVPEFAAALNKVVARKQIELHFKHDLQELRPASREAIFKVTDASGAVSEKVINYALIHVTPPMSAPDFIKHSPLAVEDGPLKGWLAADKHTLQHPKYPNVFGIGDVAALPNSKTGAAIRKEAPVLVENLLALMDGRTPSASYDGYSSCPLVTDYGKLVLAEFNYENKPTPSFPFNTAKERWDMYMLKKHALPVLYWEGMLKGRA
ncbi:MAG: FAD/NAD(P)-binding oxidoreductase [Deinococcales bacterium]